MSKPISFRYVFFYSEKFKRYKLVKVKADDFNPKNPKVLWIFDEKKLHIAKRILNNMNLATENSQLPFMQVAS